VRKERGIEVRRGRPAYAGFRPGRPGHPGGIRFMFDRGPVGDAALAAITVQPEEIAGYRLVPLDTAFALLRPPVRRRCAPHRGTADSSTWKTAVQFPESAKPGIWLAGPCRQRLAGP
jgi:hypothetical protein